MKITISGKNIDVTEGLKAAVNEKLGKLEKYFTPDTNVIVTLSVEKERQKIEVTIPVKGNIIRSGAGKQRYVRIHRSGRGSHRTPASQIQKTKLPTNSRKQETSRKNIWSMTIWRTKTSRSSVRKNSA